MAALAKQLERLATMSPADLRGAWTEAWRMPAPRLSVELLRFGIAYRLQEQTHGGLPDRTARVLHRLSGGRADAKRQLRPGTQLVRSWHGRTISVLVTGDGFLFEDRSYGSLTAIAREVTGAGWSGPRFFGLTEGKH